MAMDEKKLESINEAFANEETIPDPGTPAPKKTKAARRRRRIIIRVVCFLAAVLALGAATMVWYFQKEFEGRFYIDTMALGQDVSGLTPGEAALRLYAQAKTLPVTLRDTDQGDLAALTVASFLTETKLRDLCISLIEQQHQDPGLISLIDRKFDVYTPELFADLTDADVSAVLRSALYGEGEPVVPVNAELVMEDTGYRVIPEVEGNLVDLELCGAALGRELRKITALEAPVDTMVTGGRILPEITAEDPSITSLTDVMDAYLSTPVTLAFENGVPHTLTAEDIWAASDIAITGDTVSCVPVEEKVNALVDQLISDCMADGRDAKYFKTAETRETVYYQEKDTGWILNREPIYAQVLSALQTGREAVVVPEYNYTWYWERRFNCGNTFIEISLDNQYVWYYLQGKLLVETPVVTGDIATHKNTIPGFFWIIWKKADTYLVGPTWNDHVDYWMPFDAEHEIGLHDSSWRDEYGGDIYLTDGSHGCVNTPLEAMRIIFNNSWEGVPVIVY